MMTVKNDSLLTVFIKNDILCVIFQQTDFWFLYNFSTVVKLYFNKNAQFLYKNCNFLHSASKTETDSETAVPA